MWRWFPLCAVLLVACDWSAADGPWNLSSDDDPEEEGVVVRGVVCSPDGARGTPGLAVRWSDAGDAVVADLVTDPLGRYEAFVAPGRYTVRVGDRLFSGLATSTVSARGTPFELDPLCLAGAEPQALVLRSASAAATDLIADRLRALGLEHVHDGPTDPEQASLLLGSPAGLVDYGIVVIAGELDWTRVLTGPSALNGLRDLLARGGGLVLSPLAWPILAALAPDAMPTAPATGLGGSALATPSDALQAELMWDSVSLMLPQDGPLFEASGKHVLLRAIVPVLEGGERDVALLLRVPVGLGRIVLSAFYAPAPRPDGWWLGDPAQYSLPDGSWDGRGAVLDRSLLQL